jgi:tetratricopeptide (TPR) repeat protein
MTAEKSAEYYNKAYALYKSGDLEAALVETEKAADWQPSNDNAVKMKVLLTGKLKEKFYAETKDGIKAAKNQYFDLGADYYIRKQYARAISEWEKAQLLDPENQSVKSYLAAARRLLKSGRAGAGISAAQAEEVKKMYYAGINAYTGGEIEKAVEIWGEALKIDPADVKSARGIEKARLELEEYKKRGLK